MLDARLFGIESFLVVLAVIFYVIVSQEEDRRVSTNVIRTQLSTLENALARIKNESNAKNEFIAILGHELRNPLSPVVSGVDMMRLKGGHDSEDAAMLEVMAERMTTVRQLLDNLLDISRIAEGKIALKQEEVNLRTVLERAVVSTEHYRTEMHQSLVFRAPEASLTVLGDAVRLEQIFSNLLSNASKYSNSGDVITLQARAHDRLAEIEVSDEGVGLSRDSLQHIFTPFHQVEQGKRSQKGLGIGLALVRSLVELHRGSVIAASEGLGRGSSFIVRLPILFDAVEKKSTSKTGKAVAHTVVPASKARTGGDGLSVLVVDDNDAAAASMGRLLDLQGCSVAYAYTGGGAIEKALDLLPDVVLLDVGLPDMDGYMVAKSLRARGYAGQLIALTGYGTADARAAGKDAGFDHYLVKPAGLAELRRVLPELG